MSQMEIRIKTRGIARKIGFVGPLEAQIPITWQNASTKQNESQAL